MSSKRSILIFRQKLLPYSETFIPAQTRWLETFEPYFTGLSRIEGLLLPPGRTVILKGGHMAHAWYKLSGRAPAFIARLRALRPALMHAHFEDGGAYGLPLARALGVPLITTFHGYDATMRDEVRYPNPIVRSVYGRRRKQLQGAGSLFIAVSDFIRRKLIARGYPEEKTVTHYIGVDTDRFAPEIATLPEPVVLFVGRLVEKKGCDYLIRAMGPVLKRRRDVKLIIIGDGPQRAALEKLAAGLRLSGVEFRGAVDPGVIKWELARACLLAAPSVTADSGDSEGLPIAICEAQAMGVPVVAFRHAGIPEIVEDGITGLLSPEKAVDRLQAGIEAILNQPGYRNQLGRAARDRAVEYFSLKKQTSLLERIYSQAAAPGAGGVNRTPTYELQS